MYSAKVCFLPQDESDRVQREKMRQGARNFRFIEEYFIRTFLLIIIIIYVSEVRKLQELGEKSRREF